ncbi:MAG: hypothetical protein QOF68_3293, partial [Gaiellales bacterium]|nr:hypothetical protein [Gaiellales bacterium]
MLAGFIAEALMVETVARLSDQWVGVPGGLAVLVAVIVAIFAGPGPGCAVALFGSALFIRHVTPDGAAWYEQAAPAVVWAVAALAAGQAALTVVRRARFSEVRTQLMVESAPDAVIVMDSDCRILEFNAAAERMFGWPRHSAIGASVPGRLIPKDERQIYWRKLRKYLRTGQSDGLGRTFERRMLRADGTEFIAETATTAVGSGDGRVFTSYVRDISERKESERRALDLAAIVATTDDAIIRKRLDGTIESWNRGAERLYGYTAEEVIGKHVSLLAADDEPDDVPAILERIGRGEHVDHFETKRKTKWGDHVYVSLTVSPLIDASGTIVGVSAIGRDITEQKRAEGHMEYLAYHDALTGLPNRAMFQEHLDLALERAKRHDLAVAVLNVDLDDFKLVNDSFGHDMGDELLRQAADRLRRVTRSTDLVARHGGDEFLILLSDLPREAHNGDAGAAELSRTIASHVQRDLHEPFELADGRVYAGGSIGCSIYPVDADTPEALLANADLAMYQAKRETHGIQEPYPEDRSGARHRLSLTAGLYKALENDEFVLHYQPIVDLIGGRIIGAEGLIRWQHPTEGLIPPNAFIPLAERSGLITRVTDWVVKQALCDAKGWADSGMHIWTGVNIPLTHLQPHAVGHLLTAIEDAGVDPGLFTIEVTETATMTNPEHTQLQLRKIRSSGVNVAIDDFGTGYSSLARLTQMPVTTLKIDRAFIRQVPRDESATAVAKTIIELSHSLGAQPLAEGVETQEQLDWLIEHG